ncbi:universal stress protein [Streptomyces sp. BI20]|uniref:universal stress protein n=1 Tax=Streptomyces sp. BI20 TaxID=3403460 RepID=UPI003C72A89D
MNTGPGPDPAFRRSVVVGFDGSPSSERALAYATGMARRQNCALVVAHVVDPVPMVAKAGAQPPVLVEPEHDRSEELGRELRAAPELDELAWVLVERRGSVCGELESLAEEYEAHAIVVGGTTGVLRRLIASVSGRLSRIAHRPVVIIP